MSISAEDLKSILQQQQAQFEQSQLRLIQSLTQVINLQTSVSSQSGSSLSFADSIAATITEFHYEPASGLTFDSWYSRWEDTFLNEFTGKDDAWKSRLLVRKLGTLEHDRFTNFILPQHPKDLTFAQTVDQLREIFGDQHSLFDVRYNCLKLTKRDADDYVTFAGIVNRECEKFQLQSLTEDQFKCHILVAGLQYSQESDIRTRLLSKLEHEKDITVKDLTTECKRLRNLKHDTAMVQQKSRSPISSSVIKLKRTAVTPGHVVNGTMHVFAHSRNISAKHAIVGAIKNAFAVPTMPNHH